MARRWLAAVAIGIVGSSAVVACGSSPTRSTSSATVLHGADPVANPVPSTPSTAPTSAARSTSPTTRQANSVDLSGAGTGAPVGTPPPTAVSVPSIGVSSTVISLGEQPNGEASVPTTSGVVAWYDQSPIPGQPGPAVLLGHVDSYTGPAVFYRLKQLVPGATVVVTEGGAPITFTVQSVQTFSKAQFPTAAVYGPTPARALRLITCGGAFDRASGHYTDNVIVFAVEV